MDYTKMGGEVTGNTTDPTRPDFQRLALQRMGPVWHLPDTLMGDTPGMRRAGKLYLPMEGDESESEWQERLGRSILFNVYKDTIRQLVGKPFSKETIVEGSLPTRLQPMLKNIDRRGRSLTVFARDLMHEAIHRGLAHFLVDVPPGKAATYRQTMERMPNWVYISPKDLLGADVIFGDDGREVVTKARIRQTVTEPVGAYGENEVKHIKIITANRDGQAGMVQVFRIGDDNEVSELTDKRESYPLDQVPLVTLYTEEVGSLEASPPLAPLAWLNLAHWQSDSDQRSILAFARLLTIYTLGFKESGPGEGRPKDKIRIGPRRRIKGPADAKVGFLETNGAGIKAGFDDLDRLEERMERFGAAQIASRSGNVTAMAKALDDTRDTSNLRAWITRENRAIRQGLEFSAMWTGETLADDVQARIFDDFALSLRSETNLGFIQWLRDRGDLDLEQVVVEAQRYGVISENIDVDDLKARLEEEAQGSAEAEMAGLARFEAAQAPPGQPDPAEGAAA